MKNSIKLFVSCSLLLTTMTYAQWTSNQKIKGNGKFITENRSTAFYDEIAITGFFDVELVAGKEGNITVKGEENLVPLIKIEVVNQVLKISTEKNKYFTSSKGKQIVIVVPFEGINQVSLTGSGDVITKNSIKSKTFAVKLIGSGDMNLAIESNDIEINLSGSGDIQLSGTTVNLDTNLNGSGDIDTSNLKATNAKATVSGSGDTTIYCSDTLYARVSGSGDIDYKGNPPKKDVKVSGSGTISKI